jgi:hypothetical protein
VCRELSEKRHRPHQRRGRRRATNSRSAARRSAAHSHRDEVEDGLAELARIAVNNAQAPGDGLEAELWASCLLGAADTPEIADRGTQRQFQLKLIGAIERLATADALATLRAMSAVGAPAQRCRAAAGADRLAARGLQEPRWADELATACPVAAALTCDELFDDGCSVIVEFDGPGPEPHTLGMFIDHNLHGLATDVFIAGPLDEVREQMLSVSDRHSPISVRDLDLSEARARVYAGLDALDDAYLPPVNEDVPRLRALIEARMTLLPAGHVPGRGADAISEKDRVQLRESFLASPHGRRWRGHEHAEDITATVIDFGAIHNHGGPLRFSPAVIEIFMVEWLARKVVRDRVFFELVPDVLRDWVAYVAARRGLAPAFVTQCTEAVAVFRDEMLAAICDPAMWGPAKGFAVAADRARVDLSDADQLDTFIQEYNRQRRAG